MYWARRLMTLCVLRHVSSWSHEGGPNDVSQPARIAVIGGGIGGTAAAYFLQQHFGDDIILDLYEPHTVGGRLAVLPIAGHTYEIGGSIIHPGNRYMVEFAKKFGLPKKEECGGSRMGLFNGEEYVFRDSSWSLVNVVKLMWRYGWDAYRLRSENQDMLKKFNRIYDLQAAGQAFRNVSDLLHALDPSFLEMTHFSMGDWFRKLGFQDLIINELVTAVTKCNYGQTADLHAFVGAIAVAGADPDLWAVMGGNKRVPEELLKHSRATLLRREVKEIGLNEEGGFIVTSVEAETPDYYGERRSLNNNVDVTEETPRPQIYDLVVVAAPLTKDKSSIQFVNFTKEFSFPGHYQKIFCTMVQGKLHPESVKLAEGDSIDEILVTNAPLIFNSIGRQSPTDVKCSEQYPDVWKIFSGNSLGEGQLNILFEERESTHEIEWLAYPHYDSDQQLGDFELYPGLYHLNAIEWAGSAMEMSSIAAKNVALLALKHWLKDPTAGKMATVKDEL
ncbi:prenylcysteine oxidase 1-like [Penaeus japonicus]|uniref:prenylcysteine oxidase 1-like n=1 Tax=Penaeus japonicus TaxID=27405 RepID=UPI001C70E462|nr:prenylcysteine oxidase 1-like [Penaeus japonicus]XP_042872146.1 prenylcysteine oxidase 1-like [Penaeus japonicus]XP_042872147.1 prenylcysteine oxidase 1-like [Penaeus japonicus]